MVLRCEKKCDCDKAIRYNDNGIFIKKHGKNCPGRKASSINRETKKEKFSTNRKGSILQVPTKPLCALFWAYSKKGCKLLVRFMTTALIILAIYLLPLIRLELTQQAELYYRVFKLCSLGRLAALVPGYEAFQSFCVAQLGYAPRFVLVSTLIYVMTDFKFLYIFSQTAT